MYPHPDIPIGVKESLFDNSPLLRSEVTGISFEHIDVASPNQTFLCLYQDSESGYVIREERRFVRTADGVVSKPHWTGEANVPSQFVSSQLQVFEKLGVSGLVDHPHLPGYLDGEWYVISTRNHVESREVFLWSPDAYDDMRLIRIQKQIDRLLRHDRRWFERRDCIGARADGNVFKHLWHALRGRLISRR